MRQPDVGTQRVLERVRVPDVLARRRRLAEAGGLRRQRLEQRRARIVRRARGAHDALDLVAAAGSSIGILVSWTADAQLHRYCNSGPYREGGSKPPVLSSGLWYLSRHPNYVGEQVFWWSLALFAVAREDYNALVGPAINSLVLLQVTHMTEAHMLGTWKSERRKREYREYARRTPAWVPLPPTTIFPTYQKEGRSD